VKNQDTTYIEK